MIETLGVQILNRLKIEFNNYGFSFITTWSNGFQYKGLMATLTCHVQFVRDKDNEIY